MTTMIADDDGDGDDLSTCPPPGSGFSAPRRESEPWPGRGGFSWVWNHGHFVREFQRLTSPRLAPLLGQGFRLPAGSRSPGLGGGLFVGMESRPLCQGVSASDLSSTCPPPGSGFSAHMHTHTHIRTHNRTPCISHIAHILRSGLCGICQSWLSHP